MNLEQTALSLTDQFPNAQQANIQRQERMLERFGQVAFGGLGVVIFAAIVGIIYMIFSRMVMTGADLMSGILLIAFVSFAGLALGYVILNESLTDKKKRLQAPLSAEPLSRRVTSDLLPPASVEQGVPSVVEDTTDLLKIETVTRKL